MMVHPCSALRKEQAVNRHRQIIMFRNITLRFILHSFLIVVKSDIRDTLTHIKDICHHSELIHKEALEQTLSELFYHFKQSLTSYGRRKAKRTGFKPILYFKNIITLHLYVYLKSSFSVLTKTILLSEGLICPFLSAVIAT